MRNKINIPKISIIVAIYNIEEYLNRCLLSLKNQTFTNFEVLCVDDGSKDGSGKIVDGFVSNDNRFKHLLKENGGLSDARNYGPQNTQGNHAGFIDSDDWVESTMFEKMYKKVIAEDSDLVACDLIYDFENDNTKNYIVTGSKGCNTNSKKNGFLSPLFAWNKLYKKERFLNNHLQYPAGLWYEDMPVTLLFFFG